jgi:adenine-specific DNA-methyltransferase
LGDLAGLPCRDDLLGVSAEEFGQAYALALDSQVRAKNGRHYTPAALADALWKQAADVLGVRAPQGLVFDPAAGAGALLLPPLRAWLDDEPDRPADVTLGTVRSVIAGRDLDPAAVWVGSVLLAAELLPAWARIPARRRQRLPALLEVGDGLDQLNRPAAVTILNPPYGRVRLSEADRARWEHALYGHANLYGLFMAAALAGTEVGGVISALVPTSWLGGAYFQRLRAILGGSAPLTRITYVPDRTGVFTTGVMQETALATFQVGASSGMVRCERLTVNGQSRRELVGSACLPQDRDKPWLLPRSPDDVPLVQTAARMTHRLGDYGWRVSTGPLVWNRRRPQLSGRPRETSLKVVWAADLDGGVLHQDRARDEMRWCQVQDEREQKFLVLSEPAVLVQRTTAPEQPRRIIAATLDDATLASWGGGVIVENHVNVITCFDPASVLTPRLLAVLLDSDPLDRMYRCLTGSVAVSAYELAALPLPPPETVIGWTVLDDKTLTKEIRGVYGL